MGVTEQLARLVVETPGATFDGVVVETAKMRFLDNIGIAISGSREASTLIALETARHFGGNPHASIIGHPDKTSTPLAGYVNGTSAHSQEYDDYTKGVTHVNVVMVPGALALAEEADVSGRDMIEAYALGFEVEARLGRGMRPALLDRGWHPNGILGAMGVAAAGARIMGLDLGKTRMALGVAASSGQGLRKNVGSMGKAYHVGNGVRAGILAASLAARGYKMDPDIVEPSPTSVEGHERFGLAETFSGEGGYSLEEMTRELGTRWELASPTTNICFHPGSTAPAATIDAVIDLVTEHDVKPDQIESITLESTPQMLAIACYVEAPDSYRARYCLPWSVAVAAIDRKAGVPQYAQARIDRGDVQPLMKRVQVVVPPDFAGHKGQWGVGGVNWAEMRLAMRLKDGRELKIARSHARGWAEAPPTWDQLIEKYRECCDGIFSKAQQDQQIELVQGLDSAASVRTLMNAFRTG